VPKQSLTNLHLVWSNTKGIARQAADVNLLINKPADSIYESMAETVLPTGEK